MQRIGIILSWSAGLTEDVCLFDILDCNEFSEHLLEPSDGLGVVIKCVYQLRYATQACVKMESCCGEIKVNH